MQKLKIDIHCMKQWVQDLPPSINKGVTLGFIKKMEKRIIESQDDGAIHIGHSHKPALEESLNKCELLSKKLAILIQAVDSAQSYLTCMDDLQDMMGESNEQLALDALNKGMQEIKELKDESKDY